MPVNIPLALLIAFCCLAFLALTVGERLYNVGEAVEASIEASGERHEIGTLGAAMLAGVGAGLYASLQDAASAMRGAVRHFQPAGQSIAGREAAWRRALLAV